MSQIVIWCPRRGRFLRPVPIYTLGSIAMVLMWALVIFAYSTPNHLHLVVR